MAKEKGKAEGGKPRGTSMMTPLPDSRRHAWANESISAR